MGCRAPQENNQGALSSVVSCTVVSYPILPFPFVHRLSSPPSPSLPFPASIRSCPPYLPSPSLLLLSASSLSLSLSLALSLTLTLSLSLTLTLTLLQFDDVF